MVGFVKTTEGMCLCVFKDIFFYKGHFSSSVSELSEAARKFENPCTEGNFCDRFGKTFHIKTCVLAEHNKHSIIAHWGEVLHKTP